MFFYRMVSEKYWKVKAGKLKPFINFRLLEEHPPI